MAQAQSEIRYLTPPTVDTKKKKYCRFKKSGIKYIDYKDPEFLKKFLNEQGKILPRRITGTSLKTFSMDKSIEREWDTEVKSILKSQNIEGEY